MRRNASTRHEYPPSIVAQVLAHVRPASSSSGAPWLMGISALQGCGKTTLAAQCVSAAQANGTSAIAMSLDDFYFGRRQRKQLARTVHPLFATRGVPGTHDIALLERTLDALSRASEDTPARIPRFDKGRDTRVVPSRWKRVSHVPDLIVLEGWCLGVPAQPDTDLQRPTNYLERDEDAHAQWRRALNHALSDDYARLWRRLDRLVVLQAPGFEVVATWRDEQEFKLRERHAAHAMSPAGLLRFIQHYERLSRHALTKLGARADLVLELDSRRTVVRIITAAPDAASYARSFRY